MEMGEQNNLTECAKVRESYGLNRTEVAEEIGISLPVYSITEKQSRPVSLNRMEKLFHQIHHASKRIISRKHQQAQDLELNTYCSDGKQFNSIEEAIEDELDFELHYEILTEDLFQEILMQYIFKNKTVVKASADTGVCEEVLKKRLEKEGIPFEMGDNWEKLVK